MMRTSVGRAPEAMQDAAVINESLAYAHLRSWDCTMPAKKPDNFKKGVTSGLPMHRIGLRHKK